MIICYITQIGQLALDSLEDQNVSIQKFSDIGQFVDFYATNTNRDVAVIYEVAGQQDIRRLQELRFKQNIFIMIVGPADSNLSLQAGRLGADAYVFQNELDLAKLKEQLINSRKNIKERLGVSRLSVFSGIHGGIGTTTIAMNLAKLLAAVYPERKILLVDGAVTKAVSNLFFDAPAPKLTLADVAASGYDSPELLQDILIKRDGNLYVLPGIQRPIDRRELEKRDGIDRILRFLEFSKQYFNDIIVDLGVFEDVPLKNRLNEFADSSYVIVELSIPSISILKTQLDFMFRSGWASKTHLVINRHDAQGNFDVEEAIKVIREDEIYPYRIDFMLPNDSKDLREAWNEASLVVDLAPTAPFTKALGDFIQQQFSGDSTRTADIPASAQEEISGGGLLKWLKGRVRR